MNTLEIPKETISKNGVENKPSARELTPAKRDAHGNRLDYFFYARRPMAARKRAEDAAFQGVLDETEDPKQRALIKFLHDDKLYEATQDVHRVKREVCEELRQQNDLSETHEALVEARVEAIRRAAAEATAELVVAHQEAQAIEERAFDAAAKACGQLGILVPAEGPVDAAAQKLLAKDAHMQAVSESLPHDADYPQSFPYRFGQFCLGIASGVFLGIMLAAVFGLGSSFTEIVGNPYLVAFFGLIGVMTAQIMGLACGYTFRLVSQSTFARQPFRSRVIAHLIAFGTLALLCVVEVGVEYFGMSKGNAIRMVINQGVSDSVILFAAMVVSVGYMILKSASGYLYGRMLEVRGRLAAYPISAHAVEAISSLGSLAVCRAQTLLAASRLAKEQSLFEDRINRANERLIPYAKGLSEEQKHRIQDAVDTQELALVELNTELNSLRRNRLRGGSNDSFLRRILRAIKRLLGFRP